MSVRDLKIMGDGSVSGGEYGSVKVFGDADFHTGVEAESIKIFGSARANDLKAASIVIAGSCRFGGRVEAGEVKVNGEAVFSQRVKTTQFVVNGSLRGDQELESERFISRGAFELNSLNSNDIEIYLSGRSKVKEIGAENVRVYTKSWFSFLQNLFGGHFQQLEADIIEADRIYLEKTTAQAVKGNWVTIGEGCHIKLVEYKDRLVIDKHAKVEETVKL